MSCLEVEGASLPSFLHSLSYVVPTAAIPFGKEFIIIHTYFKINFEKVPCLCTIKFTPQT